MSAQKTPGLLPCPGCLSSVTMTREVLPADDYTRYNHFVYHIACPECGTDLSYKSYHGWGNAAEEDAQDEEAKATLTNTWNQMLYRGATPPQDDLQKLETTDVVERLLAGAGGGSHWMELHREAAGTIQSLREEVRLLNGQSRLQAEEENGDANGELLPPWAIGVASGNYTLPGALLPTRDGRSMGNAIMVKEKRHGTFFVVTDSGNYLLVTLEEMKQLFYPPKWLSRVWDHPGVLKHQAEQRAVEYRSISAAVRSNQTVATLGKDLKEGDVVAGYYGHSGGTFLALQILRLYPPGTEGRRDAKVAFIAGPGGKVVYPSAPQVFADLSAYPVIPEDVMLP